MGSVPDVAHAVRDQREELGITQSDLAARAGVGRQWLVGLETGKMANPNLRSLLAVFGELDLAFAVVVLSEERERAAQIMPNYPDLNDFINDFDGARKSER